MCKEERTRQVEDTGQLLEKQGDIYPLQRKTNIVNTYYMPGPMLGLLVIKMSKSSL